MADAVTDPLRMGTACMCVCVCKRERECVCSFVNEAAHKKSGTYSREVAEIHIL